MGKAKIRILIRQIPRRNQTNYPPLSDKLSPIVRQIIPQKIQTIFTFVCIQSKKEKQPERAMDAALSGLTTTATGWEVTAWLRVKSWNLAK